MALEVEIDRPQPWGIPLRAVDPLAIRIDQITAPSEVPVAPGDVPGLVSGRVAMMMLGGEDEPEVAMPGKAGESGPPGSQGPTGWPILEVPEDPMEPLPVPGPTGPVGPSGAGSITVRRNTGADIGTRPRLNFIEGTGITIAGADDGVDAEVDLTFSATGGGGAAAVAQMPYLPDQYEEPEILSMIGVPTRDWNLYTPAWTAPTTNPAIGNGTLFGEYTQIGTIMIVRILMKAGSTTTFGSGNWEFSLPLAASVRGTAIAFIAGAARVLDASTGHSMASVVNGVTASTIRLTTRILPSGTLINATDPMTWTTSDELHITVIYETA